MAWNISRTRVHRLIVDAAVVALLHAHSRMYFIIFVTVWCSFFFGVMTSALALSDSVYHLELCAVLWLWLTFAVSVNFPVFRIRCNSQLPVQYVVRLCHYAADGCCAGCGLWRLHQTSTNMCVLCVRCCHFCCRCCSLGWCLMTFWIEMINSPL